MHYLNNHILGLGKAWERKIETSLVRCLPHCAPMVEEPARLEEAIPSLRKPKVIECHDKVKVNEQFEMAAADYRFHVSNTERANNFSMVFVELRLTRENKGEETFVLIKCQKCN